MASDQELLSMSMRGGASQACLRLGRDFIPSLLGRENIFLNGAILGITQRRFARSSVEIVAFAEVQRFLDTPVKRYSSGMYVRLALPWLPAPESTMPMAYSLWSSARRREKRVDRGRRPSAMGRPRSRPFSM
jgi:hypothetical protein